MIAPAETAAARQPVLPPPELHRLSGGPRLVLRPSQANEIVALKAYVPMGPLLEAQEEAGLSNLLQEMLLHGTARRSEDEIQDALADLGAKITTSTGSDYGSLTLRVARGQLEGALDVFEEVLIEPALAADELEKEKVRVLNRIEAQNDSLLTAAFELFRETFYGEHPYHKPVLGYPRTVPTFDTAALRSGRERFFRPGALIVAAVGAFDSRRLIERVERWSLPSTDGALTRPRTGRVALDAPAEVERPRDSQAAWLVLGFPAPAFKDDDYPVARLVDAILGGSMNSRLFTELREKRGLAYQVSCYYNDQLSHSYLAGYIGTSPDKFDAARAAMLVEFRRLAEERVPDAELRRAQQYLRGTYIISSETNAAQAARLGRYELYGLGQDFGDRLLERIEAVTPEAIRALAERWLGPYVLAAIRPRRMRARSRATAAAVAAREQGDRGRTAKEEESA